MKAEGLEDKKTNNRPSTGFLTSTICDISREVCEKKRRFLRFLSRASLFSHYPLLLSRHHSETRDMHLQNLAPHSKLRTSEAGGSGPRLAWIETRIRTRTRDQGQPSNPTPRTWARVSLAGRRSMGYYRIAGTTNNLFGSRLHIVV